MRSGTSAQCVTSTPCRQSSGGVAHHHISVYCHLGRLGAGLHQGNRAFQMISRGSREKLLQGSLVEQGTNSYSYSLQCLESLASNMGQIHIPKSTYRSTAQVGTSRYVLAGASYEWLFSTDYSVNFLTHSILDAHNNGASGNGPSSKRATNRGRAGVAVVSNE
jgi:hypothetical protein